MLHKYMHTYSSLFSDTKKKPTITYSKTKNIKRRHSHKLVRTLYGGYVPLRTLTPPPPTQCISDPLLLFSTFTLMVVPIYLKKIFFPNKRHTRKQTLTKIVNRRTHNKRHTRKQALTKIVNRRTLQAQIVE